MSKQGKSTLELATGLSLDNTTTGLFTNRISVEEFSGFSIQANLVYGVGEDAGGTANLETSLDGTNWVTVPDSYLAFNSGGESLIWMAKDDTFFKYLRVKFLAATVGTAGATTNVIFVGYIKE